jgi:hypothetical protein
MAKAAMFTGLVFDEWGKPASVAYVGQNACYVVMEDDFKRHIDAAGVDRQVLRFLRQQVDSNREMAVKQALEMMGKDDIFSKVAVESSIDNIENNVGNTIPEEARQWMGMLGFRIVIDTQGTVIDIQMPGSVGGEEDE